MSAKLEVLHCAPPAGPDAVSILEGALEKARAGELCGVAIAIVYRDGSTEHAHSRCDALATLIGSVSRLWLKLTLA